MNKLKAFWDALTTNQNMVVLLVLTALNVVGLWMELSEPNQGGKYLLYLASALFLLDVVMVCTGLNKRR